MITLIVSKLNKGGLNKESAKHWESYTGKNDNLSVHVEIIKAY